MGNFKGHALPGSLFLIGGLWWAGKFSLCYATRRSKSAGVIAGRALQRRLELFEGSVMLSFSMIGMLAEQFVSDGPHLHLYDYSTQRWNHLMNWQHATMYLFFGLAGIVSLAVHCTTAAPLAMDRLVLGIAFFNEGFLFFYHLHGREMLDVHVHQLLLYAIFGGALSSFMEVFQRGNILLELLRAALSVLQGTWFWQIGFVLYPPSGLAEWNLKDHNSMMFITICFCWHLAFSLFTVSVVYYTVCWVVRCRSRKAQPMEMGLLKATEKEMESDEDV